MKSYADHGQDWLKPSNHLHLSMRQAELSIGARQMRDYCTVYLLMLCLRIRGVAYVAQDTLLWKGKTCPART